MSSYEVREAGGLLSKKYQIFHVYNDGTATRLDLPPMTEDMARAVAAQLHTAYVGGAMSCDASVGHPAYTMATKHVIGELHRLQVARTVDSLRDGETLTITFDPIVINK